jgi:CRISPR-associated protein (TIGR03984 family)
MLWHARIFNHSGEVYVWRNSADSWCARSIIDGAGPGGFAECIDEDQILLGTETNPENNEFTRMSDGGERLEHIVPIVVQPKSGATPNYRFDERPLRLTVRQYLKEDLVTGAVSIAATRLVMLSVINNAA